uniref:Uncharacterized protein n=1 Tax=Arundo donax TaxID=35708 RepID=A0A0A9DK53_ARUDO
MITSSNSELFAKESTPKYAHNYQYDLSGYLTSHITYPSIQLEQEIMRHMWLPATCSHVVTFLVP